MSQIPGREFLQHKGVTALDWIRRLLLNKRNLVRYGLRLATEADIDFVMNQIISGAESGHFLFEPVQSDAYRKMLRNVIQRNIMNRYTERGVEVIRARLWIYGAPGDDRVGFLLVAQRQMGSDDIELYQTSVKGQRRKQGHGKRIVQLFVYYTPPNATLYARCYKVSKAMFSILQKHGFRHINTTQGGTRELEYQKRNWPINSKESPRLL